MRYIEMIEGSHLVRWVDAVTTTGDVDYPGTAMEICDEQGTELFHVVVDSSGEKQVLFLAHPSNYRMPLAQLEEIVAAAKEKVRAIRET